MGVKATFNTITRVITLIEAPVLENGDFVVDVDVKVDLYSDGKKDWRGSETLRKLIFPIRAVGGDARPGGKKGASFFLRPDWKIQPYLASHRLRIAGDFYSDDGTTPFLSVPGETLFLEQNLSALVEVEDIEVAAVEDVASAVWSADLSTYLSGTAGFILRKIYSVVKAIQGMI